MSSCLFHSEGQSHGQSDRQTDMTELIIAFRNFANEPKKATGNAHTFL